MTVTVNPVDDVPTAGTDTATVDADTPVDIPVLDNDDFGDDGPGSVAITTPPTNGTAVINDNGTPTDPTDDFITYTPSPDFVGTDTLTYTITDGNGDPSTATVTFTVNPVGEDVPIAVNDTATVGTDFTVNIPVLNNDDFGDDGPNVGVIALATLPPNGSAVVNDNGTPTDPTDDTIDYTPNPGFSGTDPFTYTITDGNGDTSTATITVTVIGEENTNPVANNDNYVTNIDTPFIATVGVNDLLLNDSDPDNDPLTVITTPITSPSNGTVVLNDDGTFTYTPSPGFTGTDSFVYQISDGNGGTAQATTTIIVSGQRGTGGADTIVGDENNNVINGLSDIDSSMEPVATMLSTVVAKLTSLLEALVTTSSTVVLIMTSSRPVTITTLPMAAPVMTKSEVMLATTLSVRKRQ